MLLPLLPYRLFQINMLFFLRTYLICNNTFYRLMFFDPHDPLLHDKRWLKRTQWWFIRCSSSPDLSLKHPKSTFNFCLFSSFSILLTSKNVMEQTAYGIFSWGHRPSVLHTCNKYSWRRSLIDNTDVCANPTVSGDYYI